MLDKCIIRFEAVRAVDFDSAGNTCRKGFTFSEFTRKVYYA